MSRQDHQGAKEGKFGFAAAPAVKNGAWGSGLGEAESQRSDLSVDVMALPPLNDFLLLPLSALTPPRTWSP